MRIAWPDRKAFAFTIFDDPDSQTLEAGREVYALLGDLGFRTTKGVWPAGAVRKPSDHGATCADPAYRAWAKSLQERGFEIGFHGATSHTSDRAETLAALELFRDYFGAYPASMAFHYFCDEAMYWGDLRLSGVNRLFYNLLTAGRYRNRFTGHLEGHPNFWGDLCRQRIRYVRSFVFGDINTLNACPFMPYHDPQRPLVNYWFASSEGAQRPSFVERLSEPNQDRLEEQGGACIMYTHFGHGFYEHGTLNPDFRRAMERLSRRPVWLAPVTTLLDHLLSLRGDATISATERRKLEFRWLLHKLRFGSA